MPRIHILGASGSGTTTLAASVAQILGIAHFDSDFFYWLPTDPPFTEPRPVAERLALMQAEIPAEGSWVLSGSAIRWATPYEKLYDLIVYLRLDLTVRMARLRRREHERYGARIAPGGDMEEATAAFLDWAAAYDTAGPELRSRAAHEAWLADQAAKVLRLDSASPVAELTAAVLGAV
ncbi:MAG TPA: hypothetical protein VGG10_18630 [Rhizomicrobium sp.]